MKTPNDIKKGLECRIRWGTSDCKLKCDECDVFVPGAYRAIAEDALAYIQQLERERDVAMILLRGECFACLHNEDGEPCRTKEICQCCVHNEDAWDMDLDYNWQWRGVQEVDV